jgi:CRP-like cAMP-binding protein
MEHPSRTGNRLLAALPQADFNLLAPHLRIVRLERDTVLVHSGEPFVQIHFPLSCLVAFVMDMPNGQAVATAVVGKEGVSGALASLGPVPSPVTVVVRLPGMAWQISAARFLMALRRSKAIGGMVEIFTRALIAQLQHVAACNALHSVDARTARWLLHLHDHVEVDDALPVTQDALAELLGVRRPTVTQVVNKLKGTGAIRANRRGQIEIDRPRLEAACCPCYRALRRRIDGIISAKPVSLLQAASGHKESGVRDPDLTGVGS